MKYLTLATLFIVTVLSGSADAQTAPEPERVAAIEAGRSRASAHRGVRRRFGWGGSVGMTGTDENGRLGYGILGLYVRVGAQFGDVVGLHLDLSGTTLVLSGVGRAALIVDVTLGNRFTLGTGVVASASYAHQEICECVNAGWDTGLMAGVPIHLAFKDPDGLTDSSRWGFGLSFDGDVGRMLDGRTAFGGHLNFGWEWY